MFELWKQVLYITCWFGYNIVKKEGFEAAEYPSIMYLVGTLGFAHVEVQAGYKNHSL